MSDKERPLIQATSDLDIERQNRELTAYATHVIPEGGLQTKLAESAADRRPLRVKLGVDPTAQHVHLGWAVVLRRLRLFQDFGHVAVLIVGDFTARVGDPSGRSKTRPRLDKEQVKAYASACLDKITSILSRERLEIRYNSEWLDNFDSERFLWLASQSTVARMLERDDFAERFKAGNPISIVEFLYPLLQAYDSVAVEADIELGGNDQVFNLIAGRDLQRAVGQQPQVCLTLPLLRGTDGKMKMSQSYGNYIAIDTPPAEMFGKLMSISDDLLPEYIRLAAGFDLDTAERLIADLQSGRESPRDAKRAMARSVVGLYHGPQAATAAEEQFDRVFVEGGFPDEIPEVRLDPAQGRDGRIWAARLIAALGLVSSNSEGKRMIEQSAVRIGGELITDPTAEIEIAALDGQVVSVGKRRVVKVSVSERP